MSDPSRCALQGDVHHYGYVVDDLERTMDAMISKLGVGPFFLLDHVPLENVTCHGKAAVFDHTSAFGQCGTFPVELMKLHRCEPETVRSGFSQVPPQLHHVAWVADDLPSAVSDLEEYGFAAWLRASLGEIRFVYQDTTSVFGHHVELHQDGPSFRGFFDMIREASVGWDGTEPIRTPPS